MFILKFFASIFLLFIFAAILIMVVMFILAKNFVSDVNDSLKDKFEDQDTQNNQKFDNSSNIPSAIECPLCGTFYAEMPKDGRCSCGAKLTK
jgi:6,7-dimethyl-8-ribityllumazine synthase